MSDPQSAKKSAISDDFVKWFREKIMQPGGQVEDTPLRKKPRAEKATLPRRHRNAPEVARNADSKIGADRVAVAIEQDRLKMKLVQLKADIERRQLASKKRKRVAGTSGSPPPPAETAVSVDTDAVRPDASEDGSGGGHVNQVTPPMTIALVSTAAGGVGAQVADTYTPSREEALRKLQQREKELKVV